MIVKYRKASFYSQKNISDIEIDTFYHLTINISPILTFMAEMHL